MGTNYFRIGRDQQWEYWEHRTGLDTTRTWQRVESVWPDTPRNRALGRVGLPRMRGG